MTPFTALVLAGSRGGVDPVAAYAGVPHKGLIVLGGRTLLERVITALAEAGAQRIVISTSEPAIIAAVAMLKTNAKLEVIPASGSPSLSVRQGAEHLGAPLLVTTVDHALLQPEWIADFVSKVPATADMAALLAPEEVVRAASPETERTYLTFRDDRYSGCNLFYLQTPAALRVLDLWRQVEAYRKQPWRIAAMLGIGTLIGYALRRLTLDETVRRLGAKAGVNAAAVRSPYGRAAIDVDKPSDLDLVRSLIET